MVHLYYTKSFGLALKMHFFIKKLFFFEIIAVFDTYINFSDGNVAFYSPTTATIICFIQAGDRSSACRGDGGIAVPCAHRMCVCGEGFS